MSSSWTFKQNKVFEVALGKYDKGAPDYWQNVAREVGDGKSVEDVRRHYAELEKDIVDIHTSSSAGGSSNYTKGGSSRGGQRPCMVPQDPVMAGLVQEGAAARRT